MAFHGQKVWYGAYSSGNCPGFSPGSLLANQTKNHNHNANVADRFLYPKNTNKIIEKVFNRSVLKKTPTEAGV